MTLQDIVVRGASEHNLAHVDVTIPRGTLTTITGVSGSGKSSLAFDTIYQEGQRRYVESLSAYARQFLGRLEKPKVDHIDGLSPTLLIDQKTVNRNPRSTVGTITEVLDYLRLLYARLGEPRCPTCGAGVAGRTLAALVTAIGERWSQQRIAVLAPVVRDRKGSYRKDLEGWRLKGYTRVWVDGAERRLDEEILLERKVRHTLELVVDRLRVEPERASRLAEAVEAACGLAQGFVHVRTEDEADAVAFSIRNTCPAGHGDFPELEPRLFSFNSPHGACPACEGLGERRAPDPARVVADERLSIRQGALRIMNPSGYLSYVRLGPASLEALAQRFDFDLDRPWKELPVRARRLLLHGSGAQEVTLEWDWTSAGGKRSVRGRETKPFEGILPALERHVGRPGFRQVERFLTSQVCTACSGTRLSPLARSVHFRGCTLPELTARTIEAAAAFFRASTLVGREDLVGRPIVREISSRLAFLEAVGLGYLRLDRRARSLSGGESQRVRLATQVGSGLQGVVYVLDEPSIGLHPRDNGRLLDTLRELRDRGNTVLVVEHDADTILAGDGIVDIGPGAGRHGGQVLAAGPVGRVLRETRTLTTDYLTGRRTIPVPAVRRAGKGPALTIVGARQHNLQDLTVRLPLGCFVVVTGVSGSGKSTLVDLVLRRALARRLHGAEAPPGAHERIDGVEHLDKVVEIDQLPIGRTPRSNPATYTGLMDHLREVFANTPESKVRGYGKGRFSFNVRGGRCESCAGAGVNVIEMQFLPDVEIPCELCSGRRYNTETLEIQYRGRSIDQVLDLTVDDALEFFQHHRSPARILQTLHDVGLGYMRLGQPSTTLSGGEAQRVKLASELCRPATGRTLYILDEPTTGLHFEDVRVLIEVLQRLVDAGNTLVVVEHNLEVVKVADWVVDLGPEGGDGGGRLVAEGTPDDVALRRDSHTGAALRRVLRGRGELPRATGRWRSRAAGRRDLEVRGARMHNLRGVDVTIPHGKLTVVTGPSGSGKTSLAFDTIFAEGQRRFVESLSTYARRFLERIERPPVESIAGLSPAIAIDQKSATRNPRSTVATSTEVHDDLRLLFSRVGTPHCWSCERPLVGWSPTEAAADLVARFSGQRAHVTAALYSQEHRHATLLSRPEEVAALAGELQGDGFVRVLVDGSERRLDALGDVGAARRIELVVDRVRIEGRGRTRLAEALGLAQQRGLGLAHARLEDGQVLDYEARPGCARCGTSLPAEGLSPRLFSFNSPVGACPACEGLGQILRAAERKLVDRPNRPLLAGAMTSRVGRHIARPGSWHTEVLAHLAREQGVDLQRPWSRLPAEFRRCVLRGPATLSLHLLRQRGAAEREIDVSVDWQGLLSLIEGWWRGTQREGWWRSALEHLLDVEECPDCHGGRLRREALAVRVAGRTLRDLERLPVSAARRELAALELSPHARTIAADILKELAARLAFLDDVGLGYLTLDRASSTLSGGEAQRIRLACQLGNRLVGVLYVLDEPSVGLHARDQARLLDTLRELRDLGNTILVVEHDLQTIEAADHVIDLGPGAGRHGGQVVAAGPPAQLRRSRRSLTGAYLSGRKTVGLPRRRKPRGALVLHGARLHNLANLEATFPLGVLTVVTGVSGSGKSSLVTGLLVPALRAALEGGEPPAALERLSGTAGVDKLLVVDQSPLGRAAQSNPATYCDAFTPIRELFAATPEARMRGLPPGRFSTNVPGGRCEACQGRGVETVEMHFLSDVKIPCEACGGRRYGRETLEVRWKGRSIADVLDLEVDEALELFAHQPRLHRKLLFLSEVGLGYVRLGQSATTLSGGEAQRVKLAAELSHPDTGRTMVVLDEPTTGLHADDVARLVGVLQRIVDRGNTVVVIEHNLDVIQSADWVLDLGPEGGQAGGRLVVAGPPEAVAAEPRSHTGRFLSPLLGALRAC